MVWLVAVIVFLIIITRRVFPGFQFRIKVCRWLEFDWRAIISLIAMGVVIYFLTTGQISFQDTLTILIAILIGQAFIL